MVPNELLSHRNNKTWPMKFQQDKSYLWLLPVLVAAVAVSIRISISQTGNPLYGTVAIPLFFVLMLLVEVHSEIALDGSWRATHHKDDELYIPMLVIKGIVSMVMLVVWLLLLVEIW